MSKTHTLKTDPEHFREVYEGRKTFEIRFNDRDYHVGDFLELRETMSSASEMAKGAPLAYTGRVLIHRVTHIMRGPVYGLEAGWVIMSIE